MPETKIHYTIEKALSYQENALILSLHFGNAVLDAKTLRKAEDSAIVEMLIQEELKFQKTKQKKTIVETGLLFDIIHILHGNAYEALKLLSTTGRIFFNGKRLVADPFSRVPFYFNVDEQQRVTGMIGETAADAIDFICGGNPPCFIKGISLQFIDMEMPWKMLKQIAQEPEKVAYRDIQEDYEKYIRYQGNSREIMRQSAQPYPLLILKDRLGAFADLAFLYAAERVLYHETVGKTLKRNKETESDFEKDLLETSFVRKPMASSQYYCPVDKIAKSLVFLLEIGWKIYDFKGNQVLKYGNAECSLSNSNQALVIKGILNFSTYKADVSHVVGAFNRRERFIQLGEGVVGLMPSQLDEVNLDGLEEAEIVGDSLKVASHAIGTLQSFWENPHISIDAQTKALKEKLTSLKTVENALPESNFRGSLRPYQQEGLNWLAFLDECGFHGILADDMGLGKTVQVLALLSRIIGEGPVLLVLPTSLLFNWEKEIAAFLPNTLTYRHHGPERLQALPEKGVILTSYTTLRMDLPLFTSLHFRCIILDEAQAIKNASTQTAQAIFQLHGRLRLSITGTPIENHLGEIWSQFRFLMPGLLGTEEAFVADIQSAASDLRYLQKIKRKIHPFILRRTKKQVAQDLPEKIEQTVWVEMDAAQRKVYEDFLAGVRGNLFKKVSVDGISKHRMEVFEAILRLRQLCCHPLLVSSFEAPSAKMHVLLNDLETVIEDGGKALVYSQFTSMLSLIGKEIKERGWNYAYLDGSTKDRETVVQQFQEDPEIPLFLISLKAGGVGLNLTAADYVFLYDPWWNDAAESQAINRAHRIGREKTVIAKRYLTVESIEEKMMKLKEAKKTLIEGLFEGDLSGSKLSEEDLHFLLS